MGPEGKVKTTMDKDAGMSTREALLTWMDQFENDRFVFDMYGETVTVDLPRETAEKVMDISLLLVDRVAKAKGELATAEYEALEDRVRENYPENDSSWLLDVILEAYHDDHLFGRYRDIEAMIGRLMPRGCPMGSAMYLIVVRPEIHKLIYAVIRHVDHVEEDYVSLAYTFFTGVLTKGWGTGFGWSKSENGNWVWRNSDHTDE